MLERGRCSAPTGGSEVDHRWIHADHGFRDSSLRLFKTRDPEVETGHRPRPKQLLSGPIQIRTSSLHGALPRAIKRQKDLALQVVSFSNRKNHQLKLIITAIL